MSSFINWAKVFRNFALLVAVGGAMLVGVQNADATGFSGYYDPANWTTDTNGHGGFVDTSNAPASITLIGPNDGSGAFGYIDFFIDVPVDGVFSFDWSYFSVDDPGFDAGFYINNGFFFLSDTSGQSGSVSVNVLTGDIIGFTVESADSLFGPGELTITNFSAPIPEPTTLTLAMLGFLGLAIRRRR